MPPTRSTGSAVAGPSRASSATTTSSSSSTLRPPTRGNLAFKARVLYLHGGDSRWGDRAVRVAEPPAPALTITALTDQVSRGEVDTVLLAMTDMQGRLQGKRLTARHFLDEVAHHGAEGCNYLLAVDVDMTPVDGYEMASWERGYGDFVMRPDLDTIRRIPWQEGTALCLADVLWHDGSDVLASPRQVLRA